MKTYLWTSGQEGQEKGPLVHVGGNVRWCRHHAEQYGERASHPVMSNRILEWAAYPFSSKSAWAIREQYRGPPKELKIESPYDPAIPLLSILYIKKKKKRKNLKNTNSKRDMPPNVQSSVCYKSRLGNSLSVHQQMTGWRRCENATHPYTATGFLHPQLLKNLPGRRESDTTERLSLHFTSYTSIEYYLAIKNENFPFVTTWVDL